MFYAGTAGAQQSVDQIDSTDWLRSLAEGGTTEGQMILLGQAIQGSPDAQYAIATMYRGGAGIPRDMVEARRWYQTSAAQGHLPALESLRYLASGGDSVAFYSLGILSRDGLGMPRDAESARQAFFWGGEEGHILAMFAEADMLRRGEGGVIDETAALARYGQIAGLARTALNILIENKTSVLDAGNERAAAQYWLGKLYLAGGGGLRRDAVRAAQWLEDAANSGLDLAQYELGRLFLHGRGVPRDDARALEWLEAAAAQGMARAATEIGLLNN